MVSASFDGNRVVIEMCQCEPRHEWDPPVLGLAAWHGKHSMARHGTETTSPIQSGNAEKRLRPRHGENPVPRTRPARAQSS